MAYTLDEIRLAAFNMQPLEKPKDYEAFLYGGLKYVYEWFKLHPEDKEICNKLANDYIFNYYCDQYREQQKETEVK